MTVSNDTLVARSTTGHRLALGKLGLGEHPVPRAALSYRLALSGAAAPGRSRTLPLAEGWPPGIRQSDITAGPESTMVYIDSSRTDAADGWVPAHQQSVRAVAITVDGPLGPYRLWIDHHGGIIGRETPLGLSWVRTDFDLAVSRFQRRTVADPSAVVAALPALAMLAASAVADTGSAPRRFLATHRDGTPVDTALLARLGGGRQSVSGDTIVVQSEPERPVRIAARNLPDDPMIQTEAHAIAMFARPFDGMIPEQTGLRVIIDSIRHAVRLDTAASAPQDALGTLASRRGGPDGIARLFVATVRAAGVPARYVTGVAVIGGALYTHAWAEVWSPGGRGGWFAVDPVRGLVPAPTYLVRLAFAGSSSRDDLLPLVANARLIRLDTAANMETR